MLTLLLQSLGVWVLLALLAIGTGTIRVYGIQPLTGEPVAHVLGTLLYVAVLWGTVWLWLRWAPARRATVRQTGGTWSARALWGIGLLWLAMTMGFEFLFGHYVAGHSWARLLADYNLLAGRIWVLVLISLLLAPRVCGGRLGQLAE